MMTAKQTLSHNSALPKKDKKFTLTSLTKCFTMVEKKILERIVRRKKIYHDFVTWIHTQKCIITINICSFSCVFTDGKILRKFERLSCKKVFPSSSQVTNTAEKTV